MKNKNGKYQLAITEPGEKTRLSDIEFKTFDLAHSCLSGFPPGYFVHVAEKTDYEREKKK